MSKGVKIVIIIVLLVLAVVIGKIRYDSIPKFEQGPTDPNAKPGMMGMPGGMPMAPQKK